MSSDFQTSVPDSEHKGLTGLLPAAVRPYALLARFDRPIGWWLLFWPCAWGVALAGGAIGRWDLLLWLLLGSIAMRGAGCVYNDIVDRDLDRQADHMVAAGLAWAGVQLGRSGRLAGDRPRISLVDGPALCRLNLLGDRL